MRTNMGIDINLGNVFFDNVLPFKEVGFAIKIVQGPFLYTNDGFRSMMKDFIKTKNIVGKEPHDIFLKDNQSFFEDEDIFLKSNNHTNLSNLTLRKKNTIKNFLSIRFKIKKPPIRAKTQKKFIGIIFLNTSNNKSRNFFSKNKGHLNDKFYTKKNKIAKLIKSVKNLVTINEKNQEEKEKFRKVIEQIENISNQDFLTSLYNRYAFEDIIKLEMKKSFRYKHSISLIIIDIDNFKNVNDNYGHFCGDEILKELSRLLTQVVRETDYVCRWGGEEFTIILPKCNVENAQKISEKILMNVRKQAFKPTKITVSIGVAQLKSNENITSWFIRADKALLKAKSNGKNRIEVSNK